MSAWALAFAAGLGFALFGCASVPSIPQQASVASYTAALESCVTTARATDAGLAGYRACRDQVDKQYGRTPEDGGAP